jgi:4-amino-4-deoxy-L-arabinose transferase-like glycosyltransferase
VLGWLSLKVGPDPEWVRLPSLLAGTATIPLVYLLGLRTVGRAAGMIGAALIALAPFMIYYSAEARGYALMMAFVTLSTLAMLLAVDRGRARWWVVYGLASCAAVYTHYSCVLVLGAQFVWLLWAHSEARRPALITNVAAAVLYLPWITGFLADLDSPTTDILEALQPFDGYHARLALTHWSFGYPYSTVAPVRDLPGDVGLTLLALSVVIALGGVAVTRFRGTERPALPMPGRRMALPFVLALATPVGGALAAAAGNSSLFGTRNLAPSWPGLALAGAAVLALAGTRTRAVAAALLVAAFAISAVKVTEDRFSRPDYVDAAAYVDEQAGPRDVVIDGSAARSPGPLSHADAAFRERHTIVRMYQPQERDHPFNVFDRVVPPSEAFRRAAARARGARILVVTDRGQLHELPPLEGYRRVEYREFPGFFQVVVLKYERPAS